MVDDLTARRDDASRPSQLPDVDAVQSQQLDTAPKVVVPIQSNASEVHASPLPNKLKSKISLAPTEQARKAPAEQELGLRHGMLYRVLSEKESC